MSKENTTNQFDELMQDFEADTYETINPLPRWVVLVFIILGPTALISGLFTHTAVAVACLPLLGMMGVIFAIYLHFRNRKIQVNREPFGWVKNFNDREQRGVVTRDQAPDNQGNNQLNDRERHIWNDMIRGFFSSDKDK